MVQFRLRHPPPRQRPLPCRAHEAHYPDYSRSHRVVGQAISSVFGTQQTIQLIHLPLCHAGAFHFRDQLVAIRRSVLVDGTRKHSCFVFDRVRSVRGMTFDSHPEEISLHPGRFPVEPEIQVQRRDLDVLGRAVLRLLSHLRQGEDGAGTPWLNSSTRSNNSPMFSPKGPLAVPPLR